MIMLLRLYTMSFYEGPLWSFGRVSSDIAARVQDAFIKALAILFLSSTL